MASKQFEDATFAGGSPECRCSCGKYYIGLSSPHHAEITEHGTPDKNVILVDNHSVGIHLISDSPVKVSDCDCNSLDRYEMFILENGAMIREYFKALALKKRQEADALEGDDLARNE